MDDNGSSSNSNGSSRINLSEIMIANRIKVGTKRAYAGKQAQMAKYVKESHPEQYDLVNDKIILPLSDEVVKSYFGCNVTKRDDTWKV